MRCNNCGFENSFFYRLKINYYIESDSPAYLPCKKCYQDLIDVDRVPLHFLFTGILLLSVLVFDPSYQEALMWIGVPYFWGSDVFMSASFITLYFLLLPPLKKR